MQLTCIKNFPVALFLTAILLVPQTPAQHPQNQSENWIYPHARYYARASAQKSAHGSLAILLQKLQVGLTVTPTSWLRLNITLQDSRAWPHSSPALPSNPWDIHELFVELSSPTNRWALQVGRRGVSFGDERLLGSDAQWCHLGRVFDGVRLTRQWPATRLSVFWLRPVDPVPHRVDRPAPGAEIYGAYASFQRPASSREIDAYLFWRRLAPASGRTPEDRLTLGSRISWALSPEWAAGLELAGQAGSSGNQQIRAWAGHVELSRRWQRSGHGSELTWEYNHASGDDRPLDARLTRFDDLYPATYDAYGFPDPFPWSGMDSLAIHLAGQLTGAWGWRLGYRVIWHQPQDDAASGPAPARVLAHQFSLLVNRELPSGFRFSWGATRLLAPPAPAAGSLFQLMVAVARQF